MVNLQNSTFRVGDWVVQPEIHALTRDGVDHHVEPKVMQVLLTLAAHPNHVVSKEDIISAVWPDTFVSDDVLTRCISILRRLTDDDPHHPHFIQTVPKVGYRLVAALSDAPETPAARAAAEPDRSHPGTLPLLAASRQRRRWLTLAMAGAVLLLAGLALATYLTRLRHNAGAAISYRTVQFTSLSGEQTQPAFSPDGQTIAFVLTPANGSAQHIYLKRIGSEKATQLTPSAADDDSQFSPAWSPDGRQIAYLSRSRIGLGLYLAEVDGVAPPRRIFIPQQRSQWQQGALSWSPDGKFLIFPDHTGSQPNSSIFQLNLQTRETRSITTPPSGWEGDLNPAYSPDGTRIAFTRATETAVRDIYWLSLSDGSLHQLTRDRMDIDSLAWSADSASVVFSSNRAGKYSLWTMALSAKQPERLAFGAEDASQPAIGPRPGELAYTQGSTVWSILRLQGGERGDATILSSTQQDSAPALSPDGRFFAIQSLRSGSQEIWISSASGESLHQLTFMGGSVTGSPAWSHTGNRILFDSRPDGHSHIFVVPAGGGQPRQLTFGNGNDIIPRWSHDDQAIYFRSNRGGRWQLWRIAASGENAQPVTSQDGIVPQESQDGRYLYFARGDEAGLWRVPTAGGPETQVLKQPSAGFWGYWAITSRGLFYLDRTEPIARIRIDNPDTGQSTTFATLPHSPPQYSGISVEDSGRSLLMTDEQPGSGRHITLVEQNR